MGDIRVRHVALYLCEACIDGLGQECHTPGCVMWLHSVDIPFHREMLTFLDVPDPSQEVISDREMQTVFSRVHDQRKASGRYMNDLDALLAEIVKLERKVEVQAAELARGRGEG